MLRNLVLENSSDIIGITETMTRLLNNTTISLGLRNYTNTIIPRGSLSRLGNLGILLNNDGDRMKSLRSSLICRSISRALIDIKNKFNGHLVIGLLLIFGEQTSRGTNC